MMEKFEKAKNYLLANDDTELIKVYKEIEVSEELKEILED